MTKNDLVDLLRKMDLDGAGCIDLTEWLRAIQGWLSPAREAVVREVFAALAGRGGERGKSASVDCAVLQKRFVPMRHTDVESGRRSCMQVLHEFNDYFCYDRGKLGRPTEQLRCPIDKFIRYYEGISAGIGSDQYFAHVVRSAWGFGSKPGNQYARNFHVARVGHIQVSEHGLTG